MISVEFLWHKSSAAIELHIEIKLISFTAGEYHFGTSSIDFNIVKPHSDSGKSFISFAFKGPRFGMVRNYIFSIDL
jgi:hypothetical protein